MVGNIPSGNFPGGIFQGEVWLGEFYFRGGIFLERFSLHNVSILIFQKMINKYNKTFNEKTYTLNS